VETETNGKNAPQPDGEMRLACHRFASETSSQFLLKVIQKTKGPKLLSNTFQDKTKLYANSGIHMRNRVFIGRINSHLYVCDDGLAYIGGAFGRKLL
jgi:hypothetical protein